MHRTLATLFALSVCLTAFGQAFTPRRPFVYAVAGASVPFSPTNIAGLAWWWNADDLTNLLNQPVNAWTDRVQQVVFTNAITEKRPIYTNYGVYFNGSMYLTNRPGVTAPHNSATFVALSRQNNGNGPFSYVNWSQSSSAGMYDWCLTGDGDTYWSGGHWIMIYGAIGNYLVQCSSITPYNELLTLCAATDVGAFTNGVLSDSAGWFDFKYDSFGARTPPLSGNGFIGPIYEILLYTNVITSTDVSNLNQYAQTWSIKGTVLTFTTQPTSIACLTNTVQSFTGTASGLQFSYQWRTNGVAVANTSKWAGANTNVLWVTNDSILYTNLSIDCVVTNLYYTTTSSVAYLTVMNDAVTNGLVGWWRFDEGSGTSTADSTGLGNAGNLTNSPGWVTGKYTNGIYFPYAATAGAASFVRVTNAASLNTFSAISLAGWVYITNAAADVGSIIIKKTTADVAAAPADPYALYEMKISTTQLYGGVSTGGAGTRRSATLVTTTSQNEWHHCVMTYDGANLKLYKDMVILTNYNAGAIAIGSNVFPVSLGASVYSGAVQPLVGLGDDFRIYNRALNTNEINALYQWTGPQQ